MRVLVAGASGFVGQRLIRRLSETDEVIALRRSATAADGTAAAERITWRACDLFSARQTELAVHGADVAVYLVHSMLPTGRLNQGDFADVDLILADNFAQACARAGIRRIVYLGGLVPPTQTLSKHLRSRLEVEAALAAYGASVVTLRAGLVLGGEGSSFQILATLMQQLPVVVRPPWASVMTQPIAADDAVEFLFRAIHDGELPAGAYDIGGDTALTYAELMERTVAALGLHRTFLPVPFLPSSVSSLGVSLVTGASRNLVSPLLDSLMHEMVVTDRTLLDRYPFRRLSLDEALRLALQRPVPSLRETTRDRSLRARWKKEVRSIQRFVLPPAQSAQQVSRAYFEWLRDVTAPLGLVVEPSPGHWSFKVPLVPRTLLELEHEREASRPGLSVYRFRGGLLVAEEGSKNARLEFRESLGRRFVIAAVHDYEPTLPGPLYVCTQGLGHLILMRAFGRRLERVAESNEARDRSGRGGRGLRDGALTDVAAGPQGAPT